MSDPVRLRRSEETGAFERGLLEAGAAERMSDAKKLAMAAAVVAGATSAVAPSAKAWSASMTFKVALGLAGVALVTGGMATSALRSAAPAAVLGVRAPRVFTPPKAAPAAAPAAPVAEVAAPATSRPAAPARVAASATALPEHDLAAEAQMLELARDALARSDPSGALAIVDRHDATFPRAELVDEARVLRIEALAAKGEVASARALGEPWLAGHPSSPYAARVRRAIGRAP